MEPKTERTIMLIRHGETDWNLEGRGQGWADIPLNGTGLRQAELLGEYVRAHMQIDRVITSDLQRCVQTADALGLPYETDERLREFNTGDLTGMTWEEVAESHPEITADILSDKAWVRRPNGESGFDVAARAAGFIHESGILKQDETWALVSHGGLIRSMICVLLDQPQSFRARLNIENTGITVLSQSIVRPGAVVEIETLNFTGHLTPGPVSDTV